MFESPENVDLLRDSIRYVKRDHPFVIEAVVVLPDHLHCILTLPKGDHNFSMRWGLIKSRFSRKYNLKNNNQTSYRAKRERCVWQRKFWEHCIKDDDDYGRHLDYVHYNPVKHGYSASPGDWPYSSFRVFVEKGLYPADWGHGTDVSGVKDLEFE